MCVESCGPLSLERAALERCVTTTLGTRPARFAAVRAMADATVRRHLSRTPYERDGARVAGAQPWRASHAE